MPKQRNWREGRPARFWSILATCLSLILSATVAEAATVKVYRNRDLGMSFPMPRQRMCLADPRMLDHGMDILLGPERPGECDDLSVGRMIGVSAFFSATDDEVTLDGLLRLYCGAPPACQPAPAGLKVPGRRSLSGLMHRPNGQIAIFVVAQTGAIAGQVEPHGVGYSFGLDTTPEHMDEDLATFRRFLKGVRVWRPD